jgi:hypothetical protein
MDISVKILFALQTGQPATSSNGQYKYQGITIPSYGSRNTNRLPTYHHLDLPQHIYQT